MVASPLGDSPDQANWGILCLEPTCSSFQLIIAFLWGPIIAGYRASPGHDGWEDDVVGELRR